MSLPVTSPLAGTRIVEASSFVAAPSAGLVMTQLGADVIRVDPPGGGSDFRRWPLAETGESLFWAGLNKGKRSVAIDYRQPRGRELLLALVTAPGPNAGIFLDNLVGRRRPTYEELAALRPDVIHAHVEGRSDGSPAVDYTINAEVGVPSMTGPAQTSAPVNHVLPAWDLLSGMTGALGIVTALRLRDQTGEGARLELALADVALAGVGHMGWLAEAELHGAGRQRLGNHMYGTFGADFETADGGRVMVVALTTGQWRALRDVTHSEAVFGALEAALGVDLSLESDRFTLRETLAAVIRPWFASRRFEEVSRLLDEAHVLWSPYRDMMATARSAREDPASVAKEIVQPGIGPVLATALPLRWNGARPGPVPAPRLGQDTEAVLAEVLGLSGSEIGRFHDDRLIAFGPAADTGTVASA